MKLLSPCLMIQTDTMFQVNDFVVSMETGITDQREWYEPGKYQSMIKSTQFCLHHYIKQTLWPLVRKRTIPTE
jgi:hypothetical protein